MSTSNAGCTVTGAERAFRERVRSCARASDVVRLVRTECARLDQPRGLSSSLFPREDLWEIAAEEAPALSVTLVRSASAFPDALRALTRRDDFTRQWADEASLFLARRIARHPFSARLVSNDQESLAVLLEAHLLRADSPAVEVLFGVARAGHLDMERIDGRNCAHRILPRIPDLPAAGLLRLLDLDPGPNQLCEIVAHPAADEEVWIRALVRCGPHTALVAAFGTNSRAMRLKEIREYVEDHAETTPRYLRDSGGHIVSRLKHEAAGLGYEVLVESVHDQRG
jgi:hypothetical protein